MKVETRLALRFVFARKKHRVIHWIARVAFAGVAVGAAGMLTVLSGFNGLDSLVRSFYGEFDPDIKVVPARGKTFPLHDTLLNALAQPGIAAFSPVREERALLRYADKEVLVTLKEVDSTYAKVSKLKDAVILGQYPERAGWGGLYGAGVAYTLGANPDAMTHPVAYLPGNPNASPANLMEAFRMVELPVSGVFAIQPEFDLTYVVVPFPTLNRGAPVYTAVEVALEPNYHADDAKEALAEQLGPSYTVLNREDQAEAVFKVLRSEGLITYLVFAFVLLLATFSLLGAVIMAILEKQRDAFTLHAMGLTLRQVRSVFFQYGLAIGLLGGLVGVSVGMALVWAQDRFSLITLGTGYMVEAYPVELRWADVALVFATVAVLATLVSSLAVSRFKVQR